MTEAERDRSVNRSPSSDWLPCDSLRWKTGPRSEAVKAVAFAAVTGMVEQRAKFVLDRCHLGGEPVAIQVLLVGVPGLEQSADELKTGLPERLLGGQPFAVEPEISLQM